MHIIKLDGQKRLFPAQASYEPVGGWIDGYVSSWFASQLTDCLTVGGWVSEWMDVLMAA